MNTKKGNSTSNIWTWRLVIALLLLGLLLFSPGVAMATADQRTLEVNGDEYGTYCVAYLNGYAWSDACVQNNGYAWSDACVQNNGYAWSD